MNKALILIFTITLLTFSCQNKTTTDHRWIRSYSESTIIGASHVVEDRKYNKNDSLLIIKMEHVNQVVSNVYDSITILSKKQILERIQPLIDNLNLSSKKIEQFFTLTETSSEEDFKLQLALLEYELLNKYVSRIGIRDVTFDTLELRFIPTKISNNRIVGELLFLASSNNLENEAKMYVNGKEIELNGRTGFVNISRDELENGKFNARIVFDYADLDLETDISVFDN